jgi:hypothetical protein
MEQEEIIKFTWERLRRICKQEQMKHEQFTLAAFTVINRRRAVLVAPSRYQATPARATSGWMSDPD